MCRLCHNPAFSAAMRTPIIAIVILFRTVPFLGQASTPPPADPGRPTLTTVEAAHEAIKHGKEQEGIEALQKLAEAQPLVRGAKRELGIAYYRTGRLTDAEKSFSAAMDEDHSDTVSVQMRGLTLFRLGHLGAAIPYLERARQWTADSNVDVNYVLGRCYVDAQRYDDARVAFAIQYKLDSQSGAAYLLMAQMLLREELPEIAGSNAQTALQISPNLALAHFVLGKMYLAKGDMGHALAQFEQERSINPTYPPLYEFLGDLYTRTGQYQQAHDSLTKALSLDQSNTGPFILIGKLFLDDDDPQTAASYLQHAAEMDSSNFITHNLLGQAYRKMGKIDDSKREFDVVKKIHSNAQ